MSDFATQGGHWYKPDGSPFYTMVGANGKERAVTLRDARKLGVWPSVTGIIDAADKYALTQYFIRKAVVASWTTPRFDGEADDAYIARIVTVSKEPDVVKRDTGSDIHGAIERHFRFETYPKQWADWVAAANVALEAACGPQEWRSERSFACALPHGHGGKTDLFSNAWVLDIKTKTGDVADVKMWPEHYMQVAANRRGQGVHTARGGILFVSRDQPTARFCVAHEDDLVRGLRMFDALLAYWYAKTGLQ